MANLLKSTYLSAKQYKLTIMLLFFKGKIRVEKLVRRVQLGAISILLKILFFSFQFLNWLTCFARVLDTGAVSKRQSGLG